MLQGVYFEFVCPGDFLSCSFGCRRGMMIISLCFVLCVWATCYVGVREVDEVEEYWRYRCDRRCTSFPTISRQARHLVQ